MEIKKPQVLIIGGGMITQVQILPSIYQLQRIGLIDRISISALNTQPLKALKEDPLLGQAFPGQGFQSYPDVTAADGNRMDPDLYREALRQLPRRSIVVVAIPDHLHHDVVRETLQAGHHVVCVKPLVLKGDQAKEIEDLARDKGLFVGIEYHKRLDDRNLLARRKYRQGLFGEFRVGQAHLMEPWYYRRSNFQNWCTIGNSDPFTYIACHYIDLIHFITGLLPAEVSVVGVVEKFPNGNRAFMWSDGRVIWQNDACLNVINGFGYPDAGAGSNAQGMRLFCSGKEDGGLIDHHDQFRGVKHSYAVADPASGEKRYHEINPDYFQMVDIGGAGLKAVGYGYRSIELLVSTILRLEQATAEPDAENALKKRREQLAIIDREGMVATPANSAYNELVIEAGRQSILNGGRPVVIEYGDRPKVRFKEISEYPTYAG